MTENGHQDTSNGNLRPPWEPGQSGNPAGRPRGSGLTDQLRRVLDEADQDDPTTTVADRLVRAVVREAKRGNVRLIELIFDRLDGPVPRPAVAANIDTRPTIILQGDEWRKRSNPAHDITLIVPPPRVIGSNGAG